VNRFFVRSCAMVLVLAAASFGQSWKGLYVGANIGGGKANSDAFTNTVFSPTGYFAMSSVPAIAGVGAQKLNPNGFTGGGQAGYNFQSGHWVLGVETDLGGMSLNSSKTGSATYPCCAPTAFTVTQSVDTSWLFTARPRLGITHGPVMLYGTGGLALTNLEYQALFTDTFATAHENAAIKELRMGFAGGGGVEFHVGSRWSVKGEYLYINFGQDKVTSTNLTAFTPPIAFPTNVFTHQIDLSTHMFRFGFNYHF
jgi:outer membrane immunogenic protein